MPNWVYNTIIAEGIGTDDRLYSIASDGSKYFDFNKIIPEPETEEECMDKYGVNYMDWPDGDGHSHRAITHNDGKSWFNWYDWHCDFWGTKWNACDTRIEDDDTVSFDTAWSEPTPIFEALSAMYPGLIFEIYVTFEMDDGEVHMTYKNGHCISNEEVEDEDYGDDEDDEI